MLISDEGSPTQQCGLQTIGATPVLTPGACKNNSRIATLAFVTADRPFALRRSHLSYLENCKGHERQVSVLVVDDSRSASARAQYLEYLTRSYGNNELRYSGRPEKLDFIAQLSRQGIDPEIASFALLGSFAINIWTVGANRNCILLDTGGELVLSADDDTVCKLVSHPERDNLLVFGNHENPREVWFYDSRNEIIESGVCASTDLLATHECLLGKRLAEVCAKVGSGANFSDACRHLTAALARPCSRVVITMTGVAGDSGAENPQCFFFGPKQVLAKLNESEAISRRAFASREVLWVSRSHTITHSPQCQGAGLGLANDSMLPPFFPVGRNEDGIFGALNLLDRNSFLAHLPFALVHDAWAGRSYEHLPSFSIATLILSLIRSGPFQPNHTVGDSLRCIGRGFLELASLSEKQFWGEVARAVKREAARALEILELNRAIMSQPSAYLEAEIGIYDEHLRELLNETRHFVPHELRKTLPTDCEKRTQRLVHEAGTLWCAWPDLVEASSFLKNRGVRLSVPAVDARS